MKKRTFILLGLLLISVCTFAQAPDWQWVIQTGGGSGDRGRGITVDDAGNIYVTGYFEGTATFGSYSLTSIGGSDIFVAKMDTTGHCLWATRAGGNYGDWGNAITIDSSGNSYVTGFFREAATFGLYSLTSNGYYDIFVAKMDTDGNWQWAIQAGGNGDLDYGNGITIDVAGNNYVTGWFEETATFGSYSLASRGAYDIFVAKIDRDGNWQWATQVGEVSNDHGYGITTDHAGNCYITGDFMETVTFGPYSLTSNGWNDIFVAKMDVNGNWLWATQAGGWGFDVGIGITVDNAGNSYVTGYFEETATFGSYSLTTNSISGFSDIFVAKMDATGTWLWATGAGGTEWDSGYAITIDDARNSYVTGFFWDTSNFGFYSLTSSGEIDIFVAKTDADGNWLWATKAGGTEWDFGYAITIDDVENIYVTGWFEGTTTFGSYSYTSSGSWDIFVAKLNNTLSVENEIIPTRVVLSNYPNPFNPETTIEYTLKDPGNICLEIYNIRGQKVKTLVKDKLEAGKHTVIWIGKNDNNKPVSSGIYLYKLESGNFEKSKKMILMK